jgi:chemotaxis protein MotC
MPALENKNRIAGGSVLAAILVLLLASAIAEQARAAPPAAVAAGSPRPAATVSARQPFQAVRTLSALQERMAQGDETAFAMQKDVVREIADELKKFPPTVWSEQRNRRALIKYALSGGDPELLREVLGQKLFGADELPLAEGALAYAEGQRSVALRHLEKVDVFALPPSLAGHVALVTAIVVANTDLARVVRLADEARLLSPGTLVEETALRLGMEGAITRGDRPKFEMLASRYFRRFPRSPYLGAIIRPVGPATPRRSGRAADSGSG